MTIEKIENTIYGDLTNSLRDRAAKKLIDENLKIEKAGRWYIVELLGETAKIYCNAKYCAHQIWLIMTNNPVWDIAHDQVKSYFRNQGERR